jgi:hypothetical protein
MAILSICGSIWHRTTFRWNWVLIRLLHNIDDLGYTPVGYTFEEAKILMLTDREKFKQAVKDSLIRHVVAINKLTLQGMYFGTMAMPFSKKQEWRELISLLMIKE